MLRQSIALSVLRGSAVSNSIRWRASDPCVTWKFLSSSSAGLSAASLWQRGEKNSRRRVYLPISSRRVHLCSNAMELLQFSKSSLSSSAECLCISNWDYTQMLISTWNTLSVFFLFLLNMFLTLCVALIHSDICRCSESSMQNTLMVQQKRMVFFRAYFSSK